MFEKIKHLKQLQSQAKQFKEMLAKEQAEGEAAFGKVRVLMDGNQKVLEVKIDPEIAQGQRESLEMALVQAYNDASEKIHRLISDKVKEYGLPGGLDLPEM